MCTEGQLADLIHTSRQHPSIRMATKEYNDVSDDILRLGSTNLFRSKLKTQDYATMQQYTYSVISTFFHLL